jgi:O-antigen ligase
LFSLAAICTLWLYTQKKIPFWIFSIGYLINVVAVLICESRASEILLAVVTMAFIVVWLFKKYKIRQVLAVVIIVAAAGLCALGYWGTRHYFSDKPELVTDPSQPGNYIELQQSYSEQTSDAMRYYLIQCAWNTFVRYPLFGVSPSELANSVSTINQMDPITLYFSGINGGGLHNSFLQVLIANGAVGAALLIALFVILAIRTIRSQRSDSPFAVVILIGLLLYGLFESILIFSNSPVSLLFWGAWGYAANRSARAKKNDCNPAFNHVNGPVGT